MDTGDRPARHREAATASSQEERLARAGRQRGDAGRDDEDVAEIDAGNPDDASAPLLGQEERTEAPDEQTAFREQFDEDLYNDREDRPAQGNTADVAMGDHRFGSEADAYSEYAWRRPGDHHSGDASAVGQARDPADIAADDERP